MKNRRSPWVPRLLSCNAVLSGGRFNFVLLPARNALAILVPTLDSFSHLPCLSSRPSRFWFWLKLFVLRPEGDVMRLTIKRL
jgi:hypothetical protein